MSITVRQPEFPGEEKGLLKYVNSKMDSLQVLYGYEEDGFKTKIIVRFIVNENGSIYDIIVCKSIDPRIDRQVIDMIRGFPVFEPGYDKGNKPIRSIFMFPLQFELSNK